MPLVWDNGWLIAATTPAAILAFRATDGILIWRRDIKSPAHAPPALAADRVYVPTDDGRVVALRVDTGAPVWERRLGGAPNDILALDDRLYVGSKDNFFYCLMADDGRVDWRWRTGGDVIGRPVADERYGVFRVARQRAARAQPQQRRAAVEEGAAAAAHLGPVRAGDASSSVSGSRRRCAPSTSRTASRPAISAGGEVAAAPHPASPGSSGPVVARGHARHREGRDRHVRTRASSRRRPGAPPRNRCAADINRAASAEPSGVNPREDR